MLPGGAAPFGALWQRVLVGGAVKLSFIGALVKGMLSGMLFFLPGAGWGGGLSLAALTNAIIGVLF